MPPGLENPAKLSSKIRKYIAWSDTISSPSSSVYEQFKVIDASSKVSILVVSLLPSTLTVKPELSVGKKDLHL